MIRFFVLALIASLVLAGLGRNASAAERIVIKIVNNKTADRAIETFQKLKEGTEYFIDLSVSTDFLKANKTEFTPYKSLECDGNYERLTLPKPHVLEISPTPNDHHHFFEVEYGREPDSLLLSCEYEASNATDSFYRLRGNFLVYAISIPTAVRYVFRVVSF
jgi:hypothetical protein